MARSTKEAVSRAGRGLVVLVVAVQALALLVSQQLGVARYLDTSVRDGVHLAEVALVAAYAAIAVAAYVAWRAGGHRLAIRLFGLYLVVVTAQLVADVALLIVAAQGAQNEPLWYLGDLVSVLALDIAIFASWYWIVDVATPGGAFIFPARDERRRAGLVDYVFLSFNTSTTFGPTTETLVASRAKLAMMIQTTLAIAILVVLASRIVSRA